MDAEFDMTRRPVDSFRTCCDDSMAPTEEEQLDAEKRTGRSVYRTRRSGVLLMFG